ncbi:MAG TPA: prepilin-type N-terminal cleavage/methylation domain-containing protein [Polyangiaceae bacterium]|nr:prepilin-type N-terminal cleavage/methylation domain-containing protein [Polyangiaceae bacterium]
MRHERLLLRLRARARASGFTLVELLIAIGVLAMVSMLLYGAFDGLERTKAGVTRLSDRYHEGRAALQRIAYELSGAYISAHAPPDQNLVAVHTAFIGVRDTPAARVDFNCFCNRRFDKDAKESDQAEISFFGSPNPDGSGEIDLARRISPHLDVEPEHGGRVEVLASNLDLFELNYLDAATGEWTEKWDSTQALGQKNKLPIQIRVLLMLKEGARSSAERSRQPLRFITKVALALRDPLTFAVE